MIGKSVFVCVCNAPQANLSDAEKENYHGANGPVNPHLISEQIISTKPGYK